MTAISANDEGHVGQAKGGLTAVVVAVVERRADRDVLALHEAVVDEFTCWNKDGGRGCGRRDSRADDQSEGKHLEDDKIGVSD